MLKKILFNFLIILVLSLSGCDDFYNFEANKLNKKAQELIEKSEVVSNTDEKIELLLNALIKIEKIQTKYLKTKIARSHRKIDKINNLNSRIDKLKIISSKQKIQKEKNANIDEIRKNIDLANVEFRNGNKLKSSLNLLNAAELSIQQIADARTKSRLSNEISKLRILLNDEENAFKNVLSSEKYINEMYTDLSKKIKNLSKVYEILHQLKKENKKKEIEEKIYLIINNEISNNDNKAIALLEIAETNLLLENINKVKIDLKKSSKLAKKSNTYLEIAKISYKIDDIDQCKLFLNKAKIAAKSKDREFWIIRELINIAIFENSIGTNEESNATLIDAKKYALLKNLDERIFVELISVFTKINNLDQAKELLNLMKPGYEKSRAMSLIGKELAIKKNISDNIPSWIKNNAGWWAAGMIPDEDFVSGIKFLIENGIIKINVEELDCDFFAFSGHKMLGPTGIGILYGKKDILENMAPYQTGGGMIEDVTMEKSTWTSIPHKFEAGSPLSAQAISLGYAIDFLNQIGDNHIETQKKLTLHALEKLNNINGITIYGNASERIPIISFNVKNISSIYDIPYLPVRLFKNFELKNPNWESESAKIFARKKRLGVKKSKNFEKDLAKMARAGFNYKIIKEILEIN